jgi:hypothetical protein
MEGRALDKKKQGLKINTITVTGIDLPCIPGGEPFKDSSHPGKPTHPKAPPKKPPRLRLPRTAILFLIAVILGGAITSTIIFRSTADHTPPQIFIIEPKAKSGERRVAQDQSIIIRGIVKDEDGVEVISVNKQDIPFDEDGGFSYMARLQDGNNMFIITARDKKNNQGSLSVSIEKGSSGATVQPVREKPQLRVLAIGVSNYRNRELALEFADNDAIAIASQLKTKKSDTYGEVQATVLTNEQATRLGIMTALQQIIQQVCMNDVVFIFVAGHGLKDKTTGSYYFLPYEAELNTLLVSGIKWSDFEEAVRVISTRVKKLILVIDTCHAGAMQISLPSMELAENLIFALRNVSGLYILGASKPDEKSLENARFRLLNEDRGHGAFTYALLKGLSGDADKDHNHVISLGELFEYTARTVPQLTDGFQHPYFRTEGTDIASDICIAQGDGSG